MQLKKFDKLLVKSFIPPFVVTFFIALFVLVMQTLWLYIDDIAGKGVGFFLLVELVSYMSVSMIPMALPVAVLISSVMVLGNLAERYELSSIKSAGVSLWRVMMPMMALTTLIGVFSFFCSNNLIPVSNLKFKSRLYDIRRQKPTLSLEESAFNDDFQGFSIRIGEKLPDDRTIRDVLLYDNSQSGQGRFTAVMADSGDMYGSDDGKYFVMNLFNGHQYLEPKPVKKKGKRNFPMVRTTFREWTKVFDLDEFELDRTDENLFKSHHTMLSNRQLLVAVDSIDHTIADRLEKNANQTDKHFFFWNEAMEQRLRERRKRDLKTQLAQTDSNAVEKAPPAKPKPKDRVAGNEKKKSVRKPEVKTRIKPAIRKPKKEKGPGNLAKGDTVMANGKSNPKYLPVDSSLTGAAAIVMQYPQNTRGRIFDKATNDVRSLRDQARHAQSALSKIKENRVKHVFEFYSKFSLAVACFIFLFVGAPMGAIVRKGGFGWPLLISIVFFMLFVVITIFSKNIAERFVIDAVLASWLNCLIIFPMGLVLTFWAMHDVTIQQVGDFFKLKWLFERRVG
jgi:lipopolysaccharide export system permease protein